MTLRRRLAALVLALAVPAGARAQLQIQEVPGPGSTPGWVLTPAFTFSSALDDNPAMAGIEQPQSSDRMAVFSPSIDADYRGRHNSLGLRYGGSFSIHQMEGLNTYEQRLLLNTRHELSRRVTLDLHDNFAAVPTTDEIMLTDVPFVRTGSKLNDAGAALNVEVGPHTSATAGYGFTWVAFDETSPYSGLLRGGTAHAFRAGLQRQVARRWAVGANGTYQRSLMARLGEGVGITTARGSVSYDATRTLSVSASLGVSHVGATTRNRARTGPAWEVAATQRFQRAVLTGSWSLSFVPAFGIGGSIQNEQVDVVLLMPAARNRLFWEGSLSWRRHSPLLAEELTLHALWLQASVGYGLHRNVRVEAFYSRSQQDSLRAGGKINRDRIGVRVVTSKPLRIK